MHEECITHDARRKRQLRHPRIAAPTALLVVFFCFGLSALVWADLAHLAEPQRQQAGVLFLSSLAPALPDIDALIAEVAIRIPGNCNTPAHFTLEYVGSSLGIRDIRRASIRVLRRQQPENIAWEYGGRTVSLAMVVVGQTLLVVLLFVSYAKRRRLQAALLQRPVEHERHADSAQTKAEEAQHARADLGGQLIHVLEEERSRIARELHDNINQRLALLANGFAELEQKGCGGTQGFSEKEVHALWQLTNEIAGDIQHLSHELHPSKLHYLGLGAAVRDLCQEFTKQYKMKIECVVRDLPRNLDDNVSLSLFRTVQESLHNAAKHSQTSLVRVELTHQWHSVRLRVSDDGIGFETERVGHQGLGLISMRERMLLVGGDFSVWSRPSLGTQIEATVPIVEKQNSVA